MMRIESERLILRQLTEEDFDAVAAYLDDESLSRYIGGPQPRTQAWRTMASILGHWTLRGFGYWAVEEKSSGTFSGCVGLWKPEGWPEMELGYWLLANAQGKGFATEAALRAREYAYNELQSPTLVSYIHPENTPSIRVAERLGAVYETTIELAGYGPHGVYRHPGPDSSIT